MVSTGKSTKTYSLHGTISMLKVIAGFRADRIATRERMKVEERGGGQYQLVLGATVRGPERFASNKGLSTATA